MVKTLKDLEKEMGNLSSPEIPIVLSEDLREVAKECIAWKETCHDCGKKIGEFHEENCDEVRCKYCHEQALSCDCKQEDKFHVEVGSRDEHYNHVDFRNKELIEWIKNFFNLEDEK